MLNQVISDYLELKVLVLKWMLLRTVYRVCEFLDFTLHLDERLASVEKFIIPSLLWAIRLKTNANQKSQC